MAKKKIYAVRKGHKTGLFETWAECQESDVRIIRSTDVCPFQDEKNALILM